MSKNRTKPWNSAPTGPRRLATKERRRTVIFCEDSKSAADYFKAFPIDKDRFEVKVHGTGMNTASLVEYAIQSKEEAEAHRSPFNSVWCVFDRDSFPEETYIRAFDLAKSSGIEIAWANEAFELWYLLHFDYIDSALSRDDYPQKLRTRGINYNKADKTMYSQLKDRQETAIKNAQRLEHYWQRQGKTFPHRENPSTTVHKLVEHLNALVALGQPE